MSTHVILGDGIAGMSAAEVIRIHRPGDEIVVVSDDPQPFYFRASLTNYLMGELSDDELFALPPDGFEQLRLRRVAARATGLDLARQRVILSEGAPLAYDRLLIATGARARRLLPKTADAKHGVPGADLPGVLVMRSLYDTKRLIEARRKAKRAVVLGGGILGIELAQGLQAGNVEVTLVHRGDWLLDRVVDRRAGELIQKRMERDGITVLVGSGLAEIRGGAKGVKEVVTTNGRTFEAQLVGVAIGNAPNTDWCVDSGLERHEGLLRVDRSMRARGPSPTLNVFAAGDVVHVEDDSLPFSNPGGLWQPSKKQGRVAGLNMAADDGAKSAEYRPGCLYNATRAWDLDLGTLGRHVGKVDPGVTTLEFEGRKDGKPVYKRALVQAGRVVGAQLLGDRREGHALRRLMNLRGAAADVSAIASRLFDPEFDLFAWVATQERQPNVQRSDESILVPRIPRPVLADSHKLVQRDFASRPEAATDLLKLPARRPLSLLVAGVERTFEGTSVRIGRARTCDVVVADLDVGAEEIVLVPEGAVWMASSSGGRRARATRNGVSLSKAAALDDYDALALGSFRAVVRLSDAGPVARSSLEGRPAAHASLLGRERHVLSEGVTGIGSGADNAIVLAVPGVSPTHAQVRSCGDPVAWFVTDVGSETGTFVNDERVTVPRRLSLGDSLRIGSVTLQFGSHVASDSQPTLPAARARGPRAFLVGITGPLARRALVVFAPGTIGRGAEADVRIDDPLLSRIHVRVEAEGSTFSLTDLGSTNGVSVEGEKLDAGRRVRLAEGARVRLGRTVYRFQTALPEERLATAEEAVGDGSGLTRTIPVRRDGPRLEVEQEGARAVIVLAGDRVTIGRDASNVAVLPSHDVSKSHAELVVAGQTYAVSDLGSRHGTRVNGLPLAPRVAQTLADGDVVEFATCRTTYRAGRGVIGLDEAPAAARASVTLVSATPEAKSEPLSLVGDGPFVIGRKAPHAMIVIPIETISKAHARIERVDGVYRLSDAGSRFGTVLRGKTLAAGESQPLHDGEVFLLQDIAVRFELASAAAGVAERHTGDDAPGRAVGFTIGGGDAGIPLETDLETAVTRELDACIGCHDCMRACPLPSAATVTIGALNGYAEGIGAPPATVREFVADCTQCHACVPVCPVDIQRSRIVLWNKLKDVPSASRRVSVQVGTSRVDSDWTLGQLASRFTDHALLGRLSAAERLALVGRSRVRRLVPGEALLVEGTYPDAMWLVVDGRIEVGMAVDATPFRRMTTLGPGGTVGEDALQNDQVSDVGARAVEATTAIGFPKYVLEANASTNAEFRAALERLHVGRAAEAHLRRVPGLAKFSEPAIAALGAGLASERYRAGDTVLSAADQLATFVLVRRGFVREVRQHGGREITTNYLKSGDAFGGADSGRKGTAVRFEASTKVEVLTIRRTELRELDRRFAGLAAALLPLTQGGVAPAAGATQLFEQGKLADVVHARDLLVIDTRLCIDCDNCVSACERRHGTSRLDRTGSAKQVGPYQIPASCYHCDDPRCLFCDVDGIVRLPSGEIQITDQCIGCGQCAERCPYDNIQMALRDPEPVSLFQRLVPDPILKLLGLLDESSGDEFERVAVKCDLCADYSNGPACVRACPVGAAARVDPLQLFTAGGGRPR